MALLKILAYSCLAYIVWALVSFLQNYHEARKIGLPIVVTPIDVTKPYWYLQRHWITAVARRMPFGLGSWTQRMHADWTYKDRYAVHAKHGPAFVEVSPVRIKVFMADDDGVEDMLKRINDFIKDPDIYGVLELFGPNVDTVNGATWSRHRKITVPAFNEKNSALVWQEALSQATAMASSWRQQKCTSTMRADLQALALNVLCYAAFGVRSEYASRPEKTPAITSTGGTQTLTYRESLSEILNSFFNVLALSLLEKLYIPPSWLGASLQRLSNIKRQFEGHMHNMIAQEQTHYEAGSTDRHNLIAALVRADITAKNDTATSSDKHTTTTTTSPPTTKGLTSSEILGNLFVYAFAGHDTTANTLAFAILHLALSPPLQDWIAEEIDAALLPLSSPSPSPPPLSTLQASYTTLFPHLPRLQALMHETLRHHAPAQNNPRITPADAPSTPLVVAGRTHYLPARTMVVANFSAVHSNPATWGGDVEVFEPRRFVGKEGEDGREVCRDHAGLVNGMAGKGFIGWSRGPRVCPGKKFSQVEFVAVLVALFAGGGRVRLVAKGEEEGGDDEGGAEGEEKMKEAEEKARRVLREAEVELVLKMREDVDVRWFVKGQGGEN